MRILLATNASYIPTRGGATRANRAWLERLVCHGHDCKVITPASDVTTDFKLRQLQEEKSAEHIPEYAAGKTMGDVTVVNGVCVARAPERSGIVAQMEQAFDAFDPDWILVSSEDFGQARLRSALRIAPEKTIYLAHTPQFFPFGPFSLNPNSAGTKAVSAAAAVVVIGEYMRQYCESFLTGSIVVSHPPVYGPGPFTDYGARNAGFVTMINPCSVKGISIFLSVAARCKDLQFAALPGWGTTPQDIENLHIVGTRILPPCRYIDEVLAKTRLLLVPSLWHEGFGLVVVEAMLRGIPVLTSNLGGLIDAKLNTRFIFPTNAIERYSSARDEHLLPIPEIPEEQDLEPWISAVSELSYNTASYRAASREARAAAQHFVQNMDADKLERTLMEMLLQRHA